MKGTAVNRPGVHNQARVPCAEVTDFRHNITDKPGHVGRLAHLRFDGKSNLRLQKNSLLHFMLEATKRIGG